MVLVELQCARECRPLMRNKSLTQTPFYQIFLYI